MVAQGLREGVVELSVGIWWRRCRKLEDAIETLQYSTMLPDGGHSDAFLKPKGETLLRREKSVE